MTEQQNNPLSGLELDNLLTELVEFYGWELLAVELRFECFANHPTLSDSLEFLRSTGWAREKLEAFYLYRYKGLPRPHDEQYKLPPRQRSFAAGTLSRERVKSQEDKPRDFSKGKQKFEPYHKSSCDKGYCSPKRKL